MSVNTDRQVAITLSGFISDAADATMRLIGEALTDLHVGSGHDWTFTYPTDRVTCECGVDLLAEAERQEADR